jgi:hypothetical protein
MQGTELLKDPSFAQTLEQSPFQANDLPGLSTAVADTFEKLSPDQRKEMKAVLDELDDLSEEELQSFLRLIGYVEQNPDQYPKLVKQLVATGAFSPEDVPQQYDPSLMAIVKTLIGQALRRVRAVSSPTFAKGGIVSLKKEAAKVAAAGRGGDTILAHINPMEADMLKRMGGRGTINPKTGLPEFGFWKTVGNIFKVGAQIVGAAILTPFVGPIAAGAIVSGASALLSGAKPADALKSALIGGTLGGITAGFSGSGSFAENAFAGGSLFGSGPAASPMLDWMKSTSIGEKLLGSIPTPGGAEAAAGAASGASGNMPLPVPRASDASIEAWREASVSAADGLKPAIEAKAPDILSSEGIKGIWDKYKLPIMLGGGALLLAGGQNKEEIKPSLTKGQTGTDLLSQQPGTYGFSSANFAQKYPQAQTPVFPGGGYIAPTTQLAQAPTPNFGQVRYPTTGIMSVKAGGAIHGPGTGTSDSIPARLSDGEFVMTARAVRGAGKGDRMKGARKMYELMHKFERMA